MIIYQRFLFYVFLATIIMLATFNSCRQKVSKNELVKYLRDPENGLYIEKESGAYELSVSYLPGDLLTLQQMKRDRKRGREIKKTLNTENTLYFNVTISDQGKEIFNRFANQGDKFQRLTNRVSYEMGQFAYFKNEEKDSIPILNYNVPFTYGMDNRTRLLFSISGESLGNSDWLELVLTEFGLGIGNQRFRFSMDRIENTPSLNFKSENNEQTRDLL